MTDENIQKLNDTIKEKDTEIGKLNEQIIELTNQNKLLEEKANKYDEIEKKNMEELKLKVKALNKFTDEELNGMTVNELNLVLKVTENKDDDKNPVPAVVHHVATKSGNEQEFNLEQYLEAKRKSVMKYDKDGKLYRESDKMILKE